MKVSVAVALPGRQEVIELELAEGSTVAEAIAVAALERRFPELDLASLRTGIWSRACGPQARLRDGDRVELYRPLTADAKGMRRDRAKAAAPKRR